MNEQKFSTSDDKLLEEISNAADLMKAFGHFAVKDVLIRASERIKGARASEHKEWLAHHEREGH